VTGAVLSVGTNSTRVLLAKYGGGAVDVLYAESRGTRLGEGLGPTGELQPHAIERTLDALRDFHGRVRGRYDRLWAVTTSAVRRADNASEFLERVRTLIGVPMDVLTGEQEARAAYRGAAAAIRPGAGERIGVIDSGGGSTEFAVGSGTEPDAVVSCEIGAVRLTEAVPELNGHTGAIPSDALERARTIALSALAPLARFERGIRIALVGGSATTAAAIASGGLSDFDTAVLSRADLQRVLRELCSIDIERRKRVPGMRPQRADILPGGMLILDTALGLLEADTAIASRWDLPLGVLLERAAGAPLDRNG
jgi:exopolyphosphatase / guanosine-5'-triphosphate,3'-diphosphate pyrophosphatase